MPVRLDAEIVDAARDVAKTMSRSVAQQISHWARLGRSLESAPGVSAEAIVAVLQGPGSYDQLSAEEQALVRAQQAARVELLRAGLRMDLVKGQNGEAYAELNEHGEVITHAPDDAVESG